MRYFTKAQIEEIRKQLATMGVRDTDLPPVTEMTGEEIVAIVQDGINKQVGIAKLFRDFLPEDIAEKLTEGKSAYEIAVEHGFVGTEEEWLASLKGEDGLPGRTGNTGATGPAGPQGPAGVTSVVASVDNNVGTPSVDVNLTGTQLNLAFHNLKGQDGEGGGGGSDYELPQATSQELGGIKIGYSGGGSKTYPLSLDSNGRAFTHVPWTDTKVSLATSSAIGGIKIGFSDNNPNNKNYPVELSNGKAYVHVPWEAGSGEGGEGEDGGWWEQAFAALEDGDVPVASDIPSVISDDLSVETDWRHFAPNNLTGELVVWMAVRWVAGTGTPESWQGPWRISGTKGADGEDGENGIDGDTIEYVYTRTNDEDSPTPSLVDPSPDPSSQGQTEADDDFVPLGWKDNAMDSSIQIDSTHRVMWMAFRVKVHTQAHPEGQWSSFVGPIPWSIYGKTGTDGDGVEYLYYAGTTAPSENPHTWNKNTVGANGTWEQREFVKDGFDNVWLDDPVDLTNANNGTKQWVCVRRRYPDNAADRSNYTNSTDVTQPYWHAFSQPALWSYKAKDGDNGTGIVADFDNDMMAVPLEANGDVKRFTQKTKVYLYDGASSIPATVTLESIEDTDAPSTSYDNVDDFNGGAGSLVTISGNELTINLWAGDVALSNKSLLVKVKVTSTADSSVYRYAILTLVGVHFGENGGSYKLGTDVRTIRHSEGVINPSAINVTCVHVDGLDAIASYTPVPASIGVLNGLVEKQFCFKYEIDDSGSVIDLNSASIPTSSIQDNVRIMLYYGDNPNNLATLLLVDQETIFVLSDGVTPSARFKSVVFKRSQTRPSTPDVDVNKNGSDAQDSRGNTNSRYGGTFSDPVPYGWSDGIPTYDNNLSDDENSLWMTTRIFIEDPTTAQQTVWTTPQRAMDSSDYDIEFALMQPGDVIPATPVDGTNGNRHGCSPASNQVWFDPALDKYTSGTNRRDFTQMVWRAERYTRNGIAEDWVITRIKGERGANGDDGRGIASMVTTYGISNSASTMPANWVNDITSLTPLAGDWIWSRVVITYDDNPPTTDTFYTKYRQVDDGTDGTFTAVPFRGAYANDVVYYGNTSRTDIVYHRGSGKYYRANPLAPVADGAFLGVEPSVTSGWQNYWLEFGENYDNLATGFAFIEDLVVMKLNTAGEGASATDARIQISGNDLYVYDNGGLSKVHITADNIDFATEGYSYGIISDAMVEGTKHRGTSGSGTDSLNLILSRFIVSGVTAGSSVIVNVPALEAALHIARQSGGSYSNVNVVAGIYDSSNLLVQYITSSYNSSTGTITTQASSITIPSVNGEYTIRIVASYNWSLNGNGSEVQGTVEGSANNTGSVYVRNDNVNAVDIGKNGMIARLGNGFYLEAKVVEVLGELERTISLMGTRTGGEPCGIKISSAGVQVLKGDGTSWYNL